MIYLWNKLVIVILILSVSKVRTSNIDQSENDESLEDSLNYRLPTDIVPSEYFIRLTPHIEPSNFSFDGTVKIIGKVKKPTSKIILHVNEIQISRLNVFKTKENGFMEELKVQKVSTSKKYQFLIIQLLHPIIKGTSVLIDIAYKGKINTNSHGLFGDWYKAEDGSIRWMFATQFQPSDARRVFPCFDEPAFKAAFHVSIDVPKKYKALGNMPIKSVKDGLVSFEKTPAMSTYTLAVAFGDFAGVSTRVKNVSYSVWSSPPRSGQLSFALSVLPSVVDYMESHLNIPYSLKKLDLLAISDFATRGMENWGLITLSDITALYDSAHTPLSMQSSARNIMAHEVAHMWFGNLVTLRWWTYLWLNEAFATYFQYHAHDARFNSWNLESDFVVSYMQDGFGFDGFNNSHPITSEVNSDSEIKSIFDPESYKKSAGLIRMLEKLLGSKIFFGALRRYIEKNKFSTSTPESLYAAFEQEIISQKYSLNVSVAELMNSWTLQPGFPVIYVELNEGGLTLTQTRFLIRTEGNWTDDSLWVVPISWTSQSKANFNVTNKVTWLTKKSIVIPLPNTETDWFIFNIQQTGFYRVNYDKKMWERIMQTLKSKELEVIHEVNRASLIDDLFNLGRSGSLDYDTVLSASQYLEQEFNYIPWKAAFSELIYLRKRFTGRSEIMNYFKNYIAAICGKNYDRLGFYEQQSDSYLDKSLRELILKMLCYIEHEDCVRNSLDIFRKVQLNESFTMSPNHQEIVYCTAIRHGPPEHWNVLSDKYEKSNYAAEKMTILYGFSCSKNSSQIEKLLHKSITFGSGIKKEDFETLLSYIAHNSAVGVPTLLNFTEANSNKITDYFSEDKTSDICGVIVDVLSTEELFSMFKKFVDNISEKSSEAESFVETAEKELNWFKINAPKILRWFKAHYPEKTFESYSDIQM